jgi:hypothetical protein
MNDLSHWDFSADFTGAQAVALVFGLDLNDIQAKQSMGVLGADASAKFAPACERMKQCYDAARGYCHDSLRPPRDWDEMRPAVMLQSVELSRRIQELDPEFDHYLCNWLGDDSYSGFETQRFSRDTIANWLSAIGQKSQYTFALNQAIQGQQSPIAAVTVTPLSPDSQPSSREVTTYLNIIGALLEFVQNPRGGRDSDAAVIRELEENYGDKPGISKRTLEDKFSLAKKSLQSV